MKYRDLAFEVMRQRRKDGVRGWDREWSRFTVHVATAAFIDMETDAITARDIREWLRVMAEKPALGPGKPRKLSKHTVNRCLSLVSAVFVEAVERELRTDNPCIGAKPRKRVDEEDVEEKWSYLTWDEQVKLVGCAAVPLEDRIMIRIAIGTGMRQGEHRHLRLSDIVLDGNDPHITIRVASMRKGTTILLPPKSGKRRVIPLFGDALAAMREWVAILPTYAPDNPSGWAFPNRAGGVRQQGKFFGRGDTLRGYYKTAGIEPRPHLHHHALRHTFATNLVSGAGGQRPWRLEEIQVLMGHSSLTITQRYAHLGEDAIRRAVRESNAHDSNTVVAELPKVAEPTLQGANDGADRKRVFARGAEYAQKHVERVRVSIASRMAQAVGDLAKATRRIARRIATEVSRAA